MECVICGDMVILGDDMVLLPNSNDICCSECCDKVATDSLNEEYQD